MEDVALADKYDLQRSRVLMSGTQALVRLLLEQKRRDEQAGLSTAGFVSGYRGSPLGGLDFELEAAADRLQASDIVFRPGLNEDLAATAVWGTQQIAQLPDPRVEGVFALWYGKGPGVDRSGDPMKHGNYHGVAPHGGVLVAFGDDHAAKSSTISHQSEQALAANSIPVLYPASVREVIEFGLLGWGMSRHSGLWVGLKCVDETAESTSTVEIPGKDWTVQSPAAEGNRPGPSIHARGVYAPQEDEALVVRHRLPRALAFARANRVDRVTHGGPDARFGVVATGKAYNDLCDALRLLGVTSARAKALGLAVYKVGLIWPLEPEGMAAFAEGKEELFFVEEKRALVEDQSKAVLFNLSRRPRVTGKAGPGGEVLLPSDGQLEAGMVARALLRRFRALGIWDEALAAAAAVLEDPQTAAAGQALAPRSPYFCSGCPHNRSTLTPPGSQAFGGIGCHAMAYWMNRETLSPCQMGGEGANWIGISPFSGVQHMFQNLGDGTYAHSGLLAIRAAVAAGVNITYKILYNDAVAMTGGQRVEGSPTVADIVGQLLAEGVQHPVVVTEEPARYRDVVLPAHTRVEHRDAMMRVQEELKAVPGVTAIVYDQTCAAEARRRRKAGEIPDPAVRPFINAAVCEGCGDCSRQSNCVSILPLETPLGRKREIDQSSCNKDLSCVDGFCPSFAIVRGGRLRRSRPEAGSSEPSRRAADLPSPPTRSLAEGYGIVVAGVGGTGVITLGVVLAMAAHLEGRGAITYNMTGLAQKGGAVFSHVRFTGSPTELAGAKVGEAGADLLLVADPAAATAPEALRSIASGRTAVVANRYLAPLAQFQANPDLPMQAGDYLDVLAKRVGEGAVFAVDATAAARRALGDTIGANMFLIGFAAQKGLLPVSIEAIARAIELNGVAVAFNLDALHLGRLAACEPHEPAAADVTSAPGDGSLEDVVARRRKLLTAYQDDRLAARYEALVRRAQTVEGRVAPGSERLARAVAANFAKLLACKDEYEVARLYSDGSFAAALEAQFEGDIRVGVRMAPPLLPTGRDAQGRPRKIEFGPWIFPVLAALAALRGLRGTPLDPFGWTLERRRDRRLASRYETDLEGLLASLTPERLALTTELAALPDMIRGFGQVRDATIGKADQRRAELLRELAKEGSPHP